MKKKYKKLIWILLIAVIILYAVLNILFMAFGKAIVIGQIEKNLKLKASLKSISVGFPLSINMSKLDIRGLAKAETVSVSPSILGFLAGKIVLNELKVIRLEITLEKGSNGKLNLPQFEQKGKQPPVLLAGLKVRDGKFIFTDRQSDNLESRIVVSDINLDISKVAFPPTSLFTRFNLAAFLTDSDNNRRGQILPDFSR